MSTDPKVQYWDIVVLVSNGNWSALHAALAVLKPPPYDRERELLTPQFCQELLLGDHQSWTEHRDLPQNVLNRLTLQNDSYVMYVYLRADGVTYRIVKR